MPLPDHIAACISPETEREFRQGFVEDTASGRLRFTSKGREDYAARFARAGIDIRRIETREAFRDACRRSEWVVWDELRRMVKGHKVLEEILQPLWS